MPKKKHSSRPMAAPAVSETNWRAREDMHVLKAAAEVKADPKRHAAAKSHARTEVHHLRKVAGRGDGKK